MSLFLQLGFPAAAARVMSPLPCLQSHLILLRSGLCCQLSTAPFPSRLDRDLRFPSQRPLNPDLNELLAAFITVDRPPLLEISFPCLKFFHSPSLKCLAPPGPHFHWLWDLTSSHTPSRTLKSQKRSVICTCAPSCLTPRMVSSTWITSIYPLRVNSVLKLFENN